MGVRMAPVKVRMTWITEAIIGGSVGRPVTWWSQVETGVSTTLGQSTVRPAEWRLRTLTGAWAREPVYDVLETGRGRAHNAW